MQLCAGQIGGIEAGVHAVQTLFKNKDTEAVLLVDASNAFNALNRDTALLNIQRLCPALATPLINTYRAPTDLFMDGDVLLSEGPLETTQGDPLAMPMYALATIPLITKLKQQVPEVNQVWYADDSAGSGEISRLRAWWDHINNYGPKFGYFTNTNKTWLLTKTDHYSKAVTAFAGTGVKITTEGRPYLGVPLGTDDYIETFLATKVELWTEELNLLATIARTQPHAAHAAFTHGMASKWVYLSRTLQGISSSLIPIEQTIRTKLIPSLTGRPPPNDCERNLLALPARLGGIALANPTQATDTEFLASQRVTEPLQQAVLQQHAQVSSNSVDLQLNAKKEVRKQRREQATETAQNLKEDLPHTLKRAMELAQEKGASSWLTALPIEEFGFTLHKRAFQDALALRYNWQPQNCPATCGCGARFSIEHSLSCPKGGFPSIRHNEIRDLTANLLTEVCSDVQIEPDLQPLTGETLSFATSNSQDGARLDIAANGFWGGRYERTFFDVRVFNPHAGSSLAACYRKHEAI